MTQVLYWRISLNLFLTSALAFGQSDSGVTAHDGHWIMIFAGVMALASAMQIVVFIAAAVTASKIIKDVREVTTRVESSVMPLVKKTSDLVETLAPKVRTITENVTEISYTVRTKVDELSATVAELNQTVKDANLKTRAQVNHVDRMVGATLASTEEIAQTVVHGVRVPIRQVAGMLAGVRAGLERLMHNFGMGERRNTGGGPDMGL